MPDRLTRPRYLKVSKDDHAPGLYEDENCAQPVADTEIAALIPTLRFRPAFQQGKPVASIAALKLADLN